MRIKSYSFFVDKLELSKPYQLSFVALYYFESIKVSLLFDDQSTIITEVVPLPGYNDETLASVIDFLERSRPHITGLTLEDARRFIEPYIATTPFAASPLLTAIDIKKLLFSVYPCHKDLDFVLPTSTSEALDSPATFMRKFTHNATIKIKLSGDLREDSNVLLLLISKSDLLRSRSIKIRLDANQAYESLRPDCIFDLLQDSKLSDCVEYIEQPFHAANWDKTACYVDKYSLVPIMLDESIVTQSDLQKASKLGIQFVKLKLFKQGGLVELLELANSASELSIKTVLGNGVASIVSNRLEHAVHLLNPSLFWGASEANGFQKVVHPH